MPSIVTSSITMATSDALKGFAHISEVISASTGVLMDLELQSDHHSFARDFHPVSPQLRALVTSLTHWGTTACL